MDSFDDKSEYSEGPVSSAGEAMQSFLADPIEGGKDLHLTSEVRMAVGMRMMLIGVGAIFLAYLLSALESPFAGRILGQTFHYILLFIILSGAGILGANALGMAMGKAEERDFSKIFMGTGVSLFFLGLAVFAMRVVGWVLMGGMSPFTLMVIGMPVMWAALALMSVAACGYWRHQYQASRGAATYLAPLLTWVGIGVGLFITMQIVSGGRMGMMPYMF